MVAIESIRFGTSGLRGLATDFTPQACGRFASAFLAHMQATCGLEPGGDVLIGQDLRSSSPSIAAACAAAINAKGFSPVPCGVLPTPALAFEAMRRAVPAIMITGSHIPADRNGIKFYRPDGEISKQDEAEIARLMISIASGTVPEITLPPVDSTVLAGYIERYASLRAAMSLEGWRILVFEHSSVARELLVEILSKLGADALTVGRSEDFVPIDTEALAPEDTKRAVQWARELRFDALVSTDGDADRPLLADENGTFVRGDVLGLLTALYLSAGTIVTPVTSTSAIDEAGLQATIVRTSVGSPFVLEAMAIADAAPIIGFEANGGVLLGSDLSLGGVQVKALPTRDALLPILCVLGLAAKRKLKVSQLVNTLPSRHSQSGRIENVPNERGRGFVNSLVTPKFAQEFLEDLGRIRSSDTTDGVRFILDSGDIIHFRASGNAPELRCYTDTSNAKRSSEILEWGLSRARTALIP